MDDAKIDEEAKKVMKGFRAIGWVFLLFGSAITISFIFATIDPAAKIRINHVDTYDFGSKLGATILAALFPIIGGLFALLPERKLMPLFRHAMKHALDTASRVSRMK